MIIYANGSIDNEFGQHKICVTADHMPKVQIPHSLSNAEILRYFTGFNTFNKILDEFRFPVVTLLHTHYQHLEGFTKNRYLSIVTDHFFNGQIGTYLEHPIDFTFPKKISRLSCSMNKPREARLLMSCWLMNEYPHDDLMYSLGLGKDTTPSTFKTMVQLSGRDYPLRSLHPRWYGNPYDRKNADIFNNYLKNNIFDPSVFSIVMEPVFWEHGTIITEKYINAVLGKTIPIVYGYKVVDVLKSMGFDTFDDILDTSYQYETNPFNRLFKMVEDNMDAISHAFDFVYDIEIRSRILQNVEVVKNYKYNLLRKNKELMQEPMARTVLLNFDKYLYEKTHS